MKKNNYVLSLSVLFLTAIINKSNAQNSNGREALKAEAAITSKENVGSTFMALEGRIMDTENNFVSFAKVSLKGTNKTVQADAYGNYRFSELQPGTYTMIVSKEGFQTYEVTFVIAMPNMKDEAAKLLYPPNTKSISASPIIKDVIMRHAAV